MSAFGGRLNGGGGGRGGEHGCVRVEGGMTAMRVGVYWEGGKERRLLVPFPTGMTGSSP